MSRRSELIDIRPLLLAALVFGAAAVQTVHHPLTLPTLPLPKAAPKPAVQVVALPEPVTSGRECLARAVYFEARSEPLQGQFAVAEVVMNRVANPRFADTICGVVYQGAHRLNACQFSFACDGTVPTVTEPEAWERAQAVAEQVLRGKGPRVTRASTHYHADYVQPAWAEELKPTVRIGRHLFYRS